MILCVIIDIDTVNFMTPTHMKRSSCRPDVVKYIMAALKPEVVCISSTSFISLPIMPNNCKGTSIWWLNRK